jgi:uncharacterized membrane protein
MVCSVALSELVGRWLRASQHYRRAETAAVGRRRTKSLVYIYIYILLLLIYIYNAYNAAAGECPTNVQLR